MAPAACSFELLGNHPRDVRREVEKVLQNLGSSPGGGMLFLCGALAQQRLDVAMAVRDLELRAPILIAAGAAVLTERGEHEQMSACAGLLWKAGTCTSFSLNSGGDEPLSTRVAEAVERAAGPKQSPVAMFASREVIKPAEIFDGARALAAPIFGGGTTGKPGAILVEGDRVTAADMAGLAMHGAGRAVVRASPACRVLGKLEPVTETDGPLVLSIASRPALDALRNQAAGVAGPRPIVLAIDVAGAQANRPQVKLRGIRGIHESRGGVMVSESVDVGTRVAFAVLDGAAAAADLDATLREVDRDACGGVPRFGIYVDCAGRGPQLYGESNTDVHAIRRRFPKLPFVGVRSAFEIGPGLAGATTHLYSGVFSLFYAPS